MKFPKLFTGNKPDTTETKSSIPAAVSFAWTKVNDTNARIALEASHVVALHLDDVDMQRQIAAILHREDFAADDAEIQEIGRSANQRILAIAASEIGNRDQTPIPVESPLERLEEAA